MSKSISKKDPNNEDLDEELVAILKDIVKQCEKEDDYVRKSQIRTWKKNNEFWHGVQFIFWSESRGEWQSPADDRWFESEEGRENAGTPFYDFVINIYKAHGESIIAALSSQLPGVRFPPDDAEDDDDVTTSKTYDKIGDLIQRHNQAKSLLLSALLFLWNEGIVAAYHAPKQDKAFGNLKVPTYEEGLACSQCEYEQAAQPTEEGEMQPNCPECGGQLIPATVQAGFTESPKTRVMIELFGPLFVKVPYYARKQKDFKYLDCTVDMDRSFLKSIFKHIEDKIDSSMTDASQAERVGRAPASYSSPARTDEHQNVIPLKRVWLRPYIFAGLPKEKSEQRKKLEKLYPDGCYVCFVGDIYAESRNEDMDKYWTVGKGGLSTYIHSDPLGQPVVPIQELKNVLVNLTIETIENGIGEVFADPDVINFETYSRHENKPGMMYPARPRPGQQLGNSFFEKQRATISREVSAFDDKLDKAAQFVLGSFPSIYGGAGEGKSRTAAEYNMSRQMALQRLSIAWNYITTWWAEMVSKCVHLYVESMQTDEKFTTKGEAGNYISTWIRKAEMTGKVGEVEAEGADTFPVSTPQKQQLFFKLMELNNDLLNQAIFDPNNRSEVADLLGFPEFEIPGEDQRIRQTQEIDSMLKGIPIPIQPAIDDSTIHASVLQKFLVGQQGWEIMQTQPQIYQILMQHYLAHKMQEAQQAAAQQMQQVQPPQENAA